MVESRLIRTALLVVAGFVWSAPIARALPPELEFAKGVVAYSLGDFDKAESHFSSVLDQQPDNTQAVYYLGQVALGKGLLDRSIELLERAVGLDPANPAILLDLSLALVKAERFADAERQLVEAAGRLPDRASVHYYLGFCRYRLGLHRRALEPLQRAQSLDGGFAASAGYYLGLAHHELGQRKEAARQFQQLASVEGTGRVGSLARENLSVLAERSQVGGARWWGAFASLGFGYDSNVTLETSDSSGSAAPGTFFSVGGYLVPLQLRRDAIEVAASVFRSFNLSGETEGLNLTDLAIVARYHHDFEAGHRLELGYLFDLDLLDDLATVGDEEGGFGVFMQGHTAQVRFRIPEGRWSQTTLEYRFHSQYFTPDLRDNFGHEVLIRQELGLLGGRLRFALLAGGLFEDARWRNWDLWGLQVALESKVQIIEPLSAWLLAGWRREDHHRFVDEAYEGHRIDDLWTGAAGLSWRITDYLSLGVSYRYLNNDSNGLSPVDGNPFRYERHLVSLTVLGRL